MMTYVPTRGHERRDDHNRDWKSGTYTRTQKERHPKYVGVRTSETCLVVRMCTVYHDEAGSPGISNLKSFHDTLEWESGYWDGN